MQPDDGSKGLSVCNTSSQYAQYRGLVTTWDDAGTKQAFLMIQLGKYNSEKYLKINMATWLVFKI